MQDFEYKGIYYGTYTNFKRCAEKKLRSAQRTTKKALKQYRANPSRENYKLFYTALERMGEAQTLTLKCRLIEKERSKRKIDKI